MSRIPDETSPMSITPELTKLCESLVPKGSPIIVETYPWKESIPAECFDNVERYIKRFGGQRVLGWRLLQWANILVEGEAHAVWQSPDGVLSDITPYSQSCFLFLPAPDMVYTGFSIPNRRMAITNSPLVAELIEICNTMDNLQNSVPPRTPFSVQKPLVARQMEIHHTLAKDVGRNEPCPCGSGLKFKRCCGRF